MAGAGQQLAQQGLQLMMCRQLEQAQALALMLGELQHLVHLVSLLYMLFDHLHPFGRQPSPACHAQNVTCKPNILLAIALVLSATAQGLFTRRKGPLCSFAMLTFICLYLQSS